MDLSIVGALATYSASANQSIVNNLTDESSSPLPLDVLQGFQKGKDIADPSLPTTQNEKNQLVVSQLTDQASGPIPLSVLQGLPTAAQVGNTIRLLQNYSLPGELVNTLA